MFAREPSSWASQPRKRLSSPTLRRHAVGHASWLVGTTKGPTMLVPRWPEGKRFAIRARPERGTESQLNNWPSLGRAEYITEWVHGGRSHVRHEYR
jgi:hypothetical protein